MRVNLIKEQTIEDFVGNYVNSRSALRDWLSKLKYAEWIKPGDIQKTFNSADLLGEESDRVVFDIGGNNYRKICKYWFGETRVHLYVKWIGTHAEYTKLCKRGLQYSINDY